LATTSSGTARVHPLYRNRPRPYGRETPTAHAARDVTATYADARALLEWVGAAPATPITVGIERFVAGIARTTASEIAAIELLAVGRSFFGQEVCGIVNGPRVRSWTEPVASV
jgi:hypothetical protein